MENVWVLAAVWVGLALVATLVAIWFRISTALSEIVVGTVAQLVIGALFVHTELGGQDKLDQLSRRYGRHCSYVSRRRRTRSPNLPDEMERSHSRGTRGFLRTVSWVYGSCPLRLALG